MSSVQSQAEATFKRAVAPRGPLYALIDAARESSGPFEAEEAGVEYQSLYAGDLGEMLKNVAPYLAEFPVGSSFRHWWFEQWGNSIGILVEAPVSLTDLRRHFRTLMMVRGEDRNRYYFRFYDPRVLRVFLPSCTGEEIRRFFGPITAFYCEGQGGEELLAFRADRDRIAVKRTPLAEATKYSR